MSGEESDVNEREVDTASVLALTDEEWVGLSPCMGRALIVLGLRPYEAFEVRRCESLKLSVLAQQAAQQRSGAEVASVEKRVTPEC